MCSCSSSAWYVDFASMGSLSSINTQAYVVIWTFVFDYLFCEVCLLLMVSVCALGVIFAKNNKIRLSFFFSHAVLLCVDKSP